MDVYVMAQEVDVEVRLSAAGRTRIDALRVPAGRPVRLLMTSRDVIHSLLRPRLPGEAGRGARALHADLVRGHQARALSDPLRGVLRHRALDDARRGRGAGARGVRRLDGRSSAGERSSARRTTPSRRRCRLPGSTWSSRASGSRVRAGLRQVPLRRRHAAHRADLARPLRRATRSSRTGEVVVADEAYLTESMMDPQAEDRGRLSSR